jgi:Cys-tRNA(Pro)/Cys-tRNA(Cys) deacylase
MSRQTPATKVLDRAGVAYALATYDYDPGAERVGLQAADALGAPPSQVLKTLVVLADGKPACVVLASDREVAMKKLAAALGCKST